MSAFKDKGAAAVERLFSKAVRATIGGLAAAAVVTAASAVMAQTSPKVVGKIEWGVWVDDDGCMHWWADGGLEGYMLDRVNPKTGKPVCLQMNTCLVENTDTLFATDSHQLTAQGKSYLQRFFQSTGAVGYAIYGHTDSRASDAYNQDLSERRARAVAQVATSVGAPVERVLGFGESRPVASNNTAAGMAKNRRVEIVCYRY
jgi:outer membrane protein OmpA-like peptidoglycan-associated protein